MPAPSGRDLVERYGSRKGPRRRPGTVATTLDWTSRPAWMAAVDVVDVEGRPALEQARALIRAARTHRVLVLNGSLTGRVQPMVAVAISRMRRPPRVLLTDCTWKAGEPPVDRRVRRAAVRALDGPHMTYCVLSSFEREQFGTTWGVDPSRVRFTPWYVGLPDEELADPQVRDDGHVFAGGDSLRDYGPLLASAHELGAPLVVASRTLGDHPVPDGVRAGPVSPERFAELSASAATVVVPLAARSDRSAGHFTYLNAMALGKPVVVTDTPGVRDHVEDGRTGLIVPPGDARALAAAVRWTVAPETRAEALAMGARAREDVLTRFSADRHVACMLELVAEALAAAPSGAAG